MSRLEVAIFRLQRFKERIARSPTAYTSDQLINISRYACHTFSEFIAPKERMGFQKSFQLALGPLASQASKLYFIITSEPASDPILGPVLFTEFLWKGPEAGMCLLFEYEKAAVRGWMIEFISVVPESLDRSSYRPKSMNYGNAREYFLAKQSLQDYIAYTMIRNVRCSTREMYSELLLDPEYWELIGGPEELRFINDLPAPLRHRIGTVCRLGCADCDCCAFQFCFLH